MRKPKEVQVGYDPATRLEQLFKSGLVDEKRAARLLGRTGTSGLDGNAFVGLGDRQTPSPEPVCGAERTGASADGDEAQLRSPGSGDVGSEPAGCLGRAYLDGDADPAGAVAGDARWNDGTGANGSQEERLSPSWRWQWVIAQIERDVGLAELVEGGLDPGEGDRAVAAWSELVALYELLLFRGAWLDGNAGHPLEMEREAALHDLSRTFGRRCDDYAHWLGTTPRGLVSRLLNTVEYAGDAA